ncbi:serine protease [Roseibium aquae]|uniref:serine protease n=1 Tax=Roseibium aquae TaxID=1323746 RepID=UPI001562A06D|nr:trypsin-like peptidase domain-containing protein [Roseibium aquae]
MGQQSPGWLLGIVLYLSLCLSMAGPALSFDQRVLDSTVSVLPQWPGKAVGGLGGPAGRAPEGSGVAIRPGGYIATAYHVIEPAVGLEVRLSDGRILAAELVGADEASDIAILKIAADLPAFVPAPRAPVGSRACIVANAYGLDLSVTCGVVSANNVANAGFNAVEDFIQTDAAANPGSSGGALVDGEGRLLGMVSAIFASQGDGNIGINFAVSSGLLERVAEDLIAGGAVTYVDAGWRLERPPRDMLSQKAGALVAALPPSGAASLAGVQTGDLVTAIAGRPVRHPRDAMSALALVRPGGEVVLDLWRDGRDRRVTVSFPAREERPAVPATAAQDCAFPDPVCLARQAVFPVSGFDPLASSVRIGRGLLVTNRHVVGDRDTVTVYTPSGPRPGRVLPSSYPGDLALIEVEGLPEDGHVLKVRGPEDLTGPLHTVGADIDRREIRVFEPGRLVFEPAADAPLGRLHVTSFMQPGVSGGALVNEAGELVGIAVGGGEGRFEAIPLSDVTRLVLGRGGPDAGAVQARLGEALVACRAALDAFDPSVAESDAETVVSLTASCRDSDNYGLLLEAGRALGAARVFDAALDLQLEAAEQVPNSMNAWLSVMVSLQAAGRLEELEQPARTVLRLADGNPSALRRAFAAGILVKNRDLAEAAHAAMRTAGLPDAATAGQVLARNWPDRP